MELVEVIGDSFNLYFKICDLLKLLFANTANRLYCTLRSEVLMALHDKDVSAVCKLPSSL